MLYRVLKSYLLLPLMVQGIAATIKRDDVVEEEYVANDLYKNLHEQSNIISEQEKIIKLFDHLEYYRLIPQQTVYDGVDDLVTSKVISTSPPRLTIQPSSVQESTTSTMTLSTGSYLPSVAKPLCLSSKHESCVAETNTLDIFPSHALKSSISKLPDISVLAGREEMPSRTDSINDFQEPSTFLSQPSTKLVLEA